MLCAASCSAHVSVKSTTAETQRRRAAELFPKFRWSVCGFCGAGITNEQIRFSASLRLGGSASRQSKNGRGGNFKNGSRTPRTKI
ncbi:MAG: hypothetical protein DMF63_02370 [Acidobacteria bacterium]|nr:MAG: hypothetical protein DMF63_02370 [Acidobacteriota bacterium]